MYKSVGIVQKLNLPKLQTLRYLSGTPKPYFEAIKPFNLGGGKHKNFTPLMETLRSECIDDLKDQTVMKTCGLEDSKIDDDFPDAGSIMKIHLDESTVEDKNAQKSIVGIQNFFPVTVLLGGILIGTCSVLINILHSSTHV